MDNNSSCSRLRVREVHKGGVESRSRLISGLTSGIALILLEEPFARSNRYSTYLELKEEMAAAIDFSELDTRTATGESYAVRGRATRDGLKITINLLCSLLADDVYAYKCSVRSVLWLKLAI
ncbi:hypothetical protein EVAR_76598_1 [Eumeta japonica]|uniref:Uncharacterized protein n=1 Tax=Eumeta variegata TaxID=151549 RepID=A0A4C1T652_EUMVA|nr:hypothetical protein EVAR_76598_1 [Eumeta japonica]